MRAAPAPQLPKKPLTAAEQERIRSALRAVCDDNHGFTPFLVEFAWSNFERLDRHGEWTFWSKGQWQVIDAIEQRMAKNAERDRLPS